VISTSPNLSLRAIYFPNLHHLILTFFFRGWRNHERSIFMFLSWKYISQSVFVYFVRFFFLSHSRADSHPSFKARTHISQGMSNIHATAWEQNYLKKITLREKKNKRLETRDSQNMQFWSVPFHRFSEIFFLSFSFHREF